METDLETSYSDFEDNINRSLVKIQELHEKTTFLRWKVSTLLLKTAAVFSPEVLLELHSMELSSSYSDSIIKECHDLKIAFDEIQEEDDCTENYRKLIAEIGLIDE